jgi:hypothetical protein
MLLVDLLENNLTLPTSDLISPEGMQRIAKGWSNHYGDSVEGYYWLDQYVQTVNDLQARGGTVFRVVFLDNPEDFNPDQLGEHWTVDESQIVDYIDSIYADQNGEGGAYLIQASIKPRSITVPAGVVSGQPTEWEINLTSESAIIDYRIDEY